MNLRACKRCGVDLRGFRSDKVYCSEKCRQRFLSRFPKERHCRYCGSAFKIRTHSDANRQLCSQKCAKKQNAKRLKKWNDEHPDAMSRYNKNRIVKNPGAYKESHRNGRIQIIAALGGKCIVCSVTNHNWLHVDYIQTTRNKPFRHPRHPAYVLKNLNEFRLLCANHHYELTLTRKILGTNITQ